MGAEGERDGRSSYDRAVPPPRPPSVPPPRTPPPPAYAPNTGASSPGQAFLNWLRAPRPDGAPGIWRLGHQSRSEQEPELVPPRQLVVGALLALLLAWLAWSVFYNGYLGSWWVLPLEVALPNSWLHGSAGTAVTNLIYYGYYALVAGVLLAVAGKLGRWSDVWRRYVAPRFVVPESERTAVDLEGDDPAAWPQLRSAGLGAVADRLADDARAGRMHDVDYARLAHAWQAAVAGRQVNAFARAVLAHGALALPHPSGGRDLPARRAQHDLLTRQVRLGRAVDDPKNVYGYRTAGIAVGPEVLSTSVLAVGPAGSGKTTSVLAPIAEGLCLQALAGQAAVVVVGAAGARLGDPPQYDVVIRLGNPNSGYDLDLYGGTADPDEAAAVLAEALVGDLLTEQPEGSRRAAGALAQLLGPFRAAFGRFPTVPELRHLLNGAPDPLERLRLALEEGQEEAMLHELDTRVRASGSAGDLGALLADRIAVLDRPAFAGFFDTASSTSRPFSMGALDHPVRVRIELPERGHPEASRILTRLVLAQFVTAVPHRADRTRFVGLVLDDASRTVTAEVVRGVQQLRSANAGIVFALRSLDEVAPALRGPLLGVVGCRVAMPGILPSDGQAFADTWGTEWVEARDITDRQVIAFTTGGRVWNTIRRAITGNAVTARSVTVRQVERQRWSASELTHAVPAGHAVVSLTAAGGSGTSPLLVDLRA